MTSRQLASLICGIYGIHLLLLGSFCLVKGFSHGG